MITCYESQIKSEDLVGVTFSCFSRITFVKYFFCFFSIQPDHAVSDELYRLLNFDREQNLPTFFSTILLFISFVFLGIITALKYLRKDPYLLWGILGLVFLFLSFDEFFSIHERVGVRTTEKYNMTGVFHFSWIIPYSLFTFFFGLIYYFKLLKKLPKKIMLLFLVSGGIYVLGAIGFEALGSYEFSTAGNSQRKMAVFYTIEETLEMFGIILFIYALISYLNNVLNFKIKIKKSFS